MDKKGNKITFQEAEKILSAGHPDDPEDLERFPYGEYLCKLWNREDADGKEYREHGIKVLKAMNILLSKEPEKLLKYNLDDYLQLLLVLIRDHDQFGVLSTGEASYPILLRAANSLGYKNEDAARVISASRRLNLADMAGRPGRGEDEHE